MNWKDIVRDKTLVNEELIAKAKSGDQYAKDLVFRNNLPLVRKMARKWINGGTTFDVDELTSIGCVALTKAYNAFDISSGYKFSTLLVKIIKNEFNYAIRYSNYERFTKYKTISLDQKIDSDSESTLYDEVASEEYIFKGDIDFNDDTTRRLYLYNKVSNERERDLLHKYYVEKMTLTQISKEWGVTRQAVSALHVKILNKIRNAGNVKILA